VKEELVLVARAVAICCIDIREATFKASEDYADLQKGKNEERLHCEFPSKIQI